MNDLETKLFVQDSFDGYDNFRHHGCLRDLPLSCAISTYFLPQITREISRMMQKMSFFDAILRHIRDHFLQERVLILGRFLTI
jgi:hypothetical protein